MPNKAAALWTMTAALTYLCHGQHLLRRLSAPIAQRGCRLSLGHSEGHERLHVCNLPAAPGLVQADLLLPLKGRGTCSIQGRQAKLLPSEYTQWQVWTALSHTCDARGGLARDAEQRLRAGDWQGSRCVPPSLRSQIWMPLVIMVLEK